MFQNLYKHQYDAEASQAQRRAALLKKQKDERHLVVDGNRPIEEIVAEAIQKKRINVRQKRVLRYFSEQYGVNISLQLSEWLRERPDNMEDWLLVPVPCGKRSLVVAHQGKTAVYNKKGRCVSVFRSLLPGDGVQHRALTILDCIFIQKQNAFYVLDVLAFGGSQNLLNCDAEFRFFWLSAKWEEHEGLSERGRSNHKPFYLLEQYSFERPTEIANVFYKYPFWEDNQPELDGYLFYHRNASYTCGTTPLVGWLFPFLVPDILSMDVSEQYAKPADFADPLSYMDKFDEMLKLKWQRNKQRNNSKNLNTQSEMETTTTYAGNDTGNDEEVGSDGEHDLIKIMQEARNLEMETENEYDDGGAEDALNSSELG